MSGAEKRVRRLAASVPDGARVQREEIAWLGGLRDLARRPAIIDEKLDSRFVWVTEDTIGHAFLQRALDFDHRPYMRKAWKAFGEKSAQSKYRGKPADAASEFMASAGKILASHRFELRVTPAEWRRRCRDVISAANKLRSAVDDHPGLFDTVTPLLDALNDVTVTLESSKLTTPRRFAAARQGKQLPLAFGIAVADWLDEELKSPCYKVAACFAAAAFNLPRPLLANSILQARKRRAK